MPHIRKRRKRVKAKKPIHLSRKERAQKPKRDILQKAITWKDREVTAGKSWTAFEIPLHRLEYMYNLTTEAFEAIKKLFQDGRPDTEHARGLVPAKPNVIRQDILADFLFFKYGFSINDFTTAKNLSTSRNRNSGSRARHNSEEEIQKWPARPDVFLNCRQVPINAGSMDDMADYFRYEKFEEQLQELEGSDEENTDIDEPRERLENEINLETEDAVNASNPNSVALLRDLYQSMNDNFQWDESVKKSLSKV